MSEGDIWREAMQEFEGELPRRVAEASRRWVEVYRWGIETMFRLRLQAGELTLPGHEDTVRAVEVEVEYELPGNRGFADGPVRRNRGIA